MLVDSMVEHNGIELLVHRLTSLVEANSEEEGKAVFNILAIFENMVEVKPEVAFSLRSHPIALRLCKLWLVAQRCRFS